MLKLGKKKNHKKPVHNCKIYCKKYIAIFPVTRFRAFNNMTRFSRTAVKRLLGFPDGGVDTVGCLSIVRFRTAAATLLSWYSCTVVVGV